MVAEAPQIFTSAATLKNLKTISLVTSVRRQDRSFAAKHFWAGYCAKLLQIFLEILEIRLSVLRHLLPKYVLFRVFHYMKFVDTSLVHSEFHQYALLENFYLSFG